MNGSWFAMSATELGRGIGRGEIDPVELAEAFLDRAAQHPLGPRIYARLTPERARPEAEAARERARAGLRRGVLDGVPVSWKDLFDTAGIATEGGSALLAGRVPARDAEVLRRATHAGLVCLGKTHMSELAFSGLGYNPVTATPPSASDPEAVAGGSTSGGAASVAQGLAPAAIGSDTGGSVRIPAAWNDLVGLKTTSGRLPLDGVLPLCESFDTVGPIARSVEDCAQLLAVLEGGRPVDPGSAGLGGRRLAILETVAFDEIRDAPRAAFQSAAERLAAAGATVERLAAPEVEDALGLAGRLYAPEAYGTWMSEIERAPELMFDIILDRFRSGASVLAADHVAAWRELRRLREVWAERVAGFDAVILPTSPILPPKIERLAVDRDYFEAENLLALRNTRIANLMGVPALTLPTGVPACGITAIGRPMREEALLVLGTAMEAALA